MFIPCNFYSIRRPKEADGGGLTLTNRTMHRQDIALLFVYIFIRKCVYIFYKFIVFPWEIDSQCEREERERERKNPVVNVFSRPSVKIEAYISAHCAIDPSLGRSHRQRRHLFSLLTWHVRIIWRVRLWLVGSVPQWSHVRRLAVGIVRWPLLKRAKSVYVFEKIRQFPLFSSIKVTNDKKHFPIWD